MHLNNLKPRPQCLKRATGDMKSSSVLSLQQVLLHSSQNASSAVINLPVLSEGDTLSAEEWHWQYGMLVFLSFIGISCLRFCCQIGMCATKRQMTFLDLVHRFIYNESVVSEAGFASIFTQEKHLIFWTSLMALYSVIEHLLIHRSVNCPVSESSSNGILCFVDRASLYNLVNESN